MVEVSVGFDFAEAGDMDGAGETDCGKVVSFEVYEHVVLSDFLGVGQEAGDDIAVVGVGAAFVGAADGSGDDSVTLFVYDGFRRSTHDGKLGMA